MMGRSTRLAESVLPRETSSKERADDEHFQALSSISHHLPAGTQSGSTLLGSKDPNDYASRRGDLIVPESARRQE
jgi:hypothetical protein